MNCVGNCRGLVGITMLFLITDTFGGSLEGIERSTALSLLFLEKYQKQVAIYGERADDTYRLQFIEQWENAIGNHATVIEILNNVEKEWMYTLHLTKRSEAVIMDLILSLHAKVLAMHQVMTYLASMAYYKYVPTRSILEDCRNVTLHLFFFSQLGTAELIQSIIQDFESILIPDQLKIIKIIEPNMELTQTAQFIKNILNRSQDQLVRPNETQIQQIKRALSNNLSISVVVNVHSVMRLEEHLLLKLMLGVSKELILDEGVFGPILDLDQLELFGAKAEDINNYLTKRAIKGSLEVKYTMVDVIRSNLIGRAEMIGVGRRIITEKFECMIPNNFQIFISNNQITNNAKLENKYS